MSQPELKGGLAVHEKFMVYDFARSVGRERLQSLGWEHNEVYEGDIHEASKKAFESGLCVMLQPNADTPILYLDTVQGRFHAR